MIRRVGLLLLCLLAATAQARPVILRDCPECPPMAVLPASDTVPGRWAISQTEITWDQWLACVAAHACRGGQDEHSWGRGSRPMINVNYDDALAYAHWLSKRTRKDYRLPSEALWSFAAHAGTTTAYPWGDEVGRNHANCRECGSSWSGSSTAPVASFPPNPFGLYDMNGNVWEWTSDCWDADENQDHCRFRVIKGGAWYYLPPMAKTNARAKFESAQWSYTLGLRVVRRLEPGEGS